MYGLGKKWNCDMTSHEIGALSYKSVALLDLILKLKI
ncbi:Unannotated [Lentimonas sp. CC4]|nr:Unannotated [Lentimonas sp. CC4]CAA6685909.1 Unannotated [Lentimonas sp. CC6]CAA7076000.1 Unannotated [Lentimonas sp. CC4]CAA7168570.1 Unannotated [Lentimonas sp. CC21]CAA7180961.1 Unannotated [Lentimonas sp. CC8]